MGSEIITLRGGLGTQMMTLFHAYGMNIKNGLEPPVDEIQINIHEAPPGSTFDWVSVIFTPNIPCGIFPANYVIKNMNPCREGYELGIK